MERIIVTFAAAMNNLTFRTFFLLGLALLFGNPMKAQTGFCAASLIDSVRSANDLSYRSERRQADSMISEMISSGNAILTNGIYRIPVVVHVIDTGSAPGTGTNPSDAQIALFIDDLNKAFESSFPTFPDSLHGGINIGIQFDLAKRTANCQSTNGIIRIDASGNATYVKYGVKWSATDSGITQNDLATYSFWDNTKYLNLWLVNSITGFIAGYGFYPVSYYQFGDGVVIESSSVYNRSNYLFPHEAGHFLGLRHTFEGQNGSQCPANSNCLNDGDFICDTDPHTDPMPCSPVAQNSCTNTPFGNLVYNFMNYSCHNRFTAGQKARMVSSLTSIRKDLLISLGEQAVYSSPGITIAAAATSVKYGDQVVFSAATTGGGASPNISWWKNNNLIVNASGTTWKGTAGIDFQHNDTISTRIKSTDKCLNVDSAKSNKIRMQISNVSVQTSAAPVLFKYFPNPATSEVTFEGLPASTTIRVYDLMGRLLTQNATVADGQHRLKIPEGSSGMIYISFNAPGSVWNIRLAVCK